ncbi:MAG: Rrf2 family transcriptional regulator [Candidatus Omnitrophica bacterium]|nr:Rrf2 family transcriptional regulator [Candidatus Omnitrophota bacterium]
MKNEVKIMRITYKGDYALKAILDLALHYGNGVVTMHEVAKRADIPIKFLEQVLLDLKKGGFVESRRGKIGGYLLARAPSKIKLGEIVRFIDGPVEPIACLEKGYSGCNDLYRCVFRQVWKEVARNISEVIDNVTFEDLVNKVKTRKEAVAYQI